MSVPRFLYHCAPVCVRDAIAAEGLHAPWGVVYASGESNGALGFMAFRLMTHAHGTEEIEFNGEKVAFPKMVQHGEVDVWTIDTTLSGLDWEPGTDHNPMVFTGSSWVAAGAVPPEALVECHTYAPLET